MFTIIIQILTLDLFSKIFSRCEKSRWFLLHSLVNIKIIQHSFIDLIKCLNSPNECYKLEWDDNSYKAFYYCILLHLYHCLLFKLTKDDILHHFFMMFICGSISFFEQNKITTSCLFFLCGVPGCIDYFLLYLNKLKFIRKIIQKKIYILLNLLIRSPGCLIINSLNIYKFLDYNNYTPLQLYLSTVSSFIVFFNSQYYLYQSFKSYYRNFD